MSSRPRLYWLGVSAYSPKLSFQRLIWSFYQLKEISRRTALGQAGILERHFGRRIWKRILPQASRYAAAFYPETDVGPDVAFPHELNGIHIAPGAAIGARCIIYQNVTIGAYEPNHADQAPVIGDDVFIGAGCTIIGRCRIGNGARIGAGSRW
jgi:acetyltransferase-like isoleucine patch superfamily enzyme